MYIIGFEFPPPDGSIMPPSGLQLPGQDEAAEVIRPCHQVVPAPAHDPQMGAVGGPQLVGPDGLGVVLLLCLEDHNLCGFDQSLPFEDAMDGGFLDMEALASVMRSANCLGLSPGCSLALATTVRSSWGPSLFQGRLVPPLLSSNLLSACRYNHG